VYSEVERKSDITKYLNCTRVTSMKSGKMILEKHIYSTMILIFHVIATPPLNPMFYAFTTLPLKCINPSAEAEVGGCAKQL
jgi:hypothetical protein